MRISDVSSDVCSSDLPVTDVLTLAVEFSYWQQSIFRTLGALVFVILGAGTFVIVFLFKMMSFMQSRLGPMEAGPHGSLQLLAEVGKWLQKEDLVPERADARLFKMAPYIVLASTFLIVVVMPFGPDAYFTNLDTGIRSEEHTSELQSLMRNSY